jgi:transcription elongation factor Elf1
MKLIAYPLAAVLAALGLMFVVGAQGLPMRIVVGVILLAAAGALVGLALLRPKPSVTTVVQKIDLSGEVKLANLTCRACGGTLGKESVTVKAGAVFVNCQYCGATYQIEEEPKW